MPPSQPIDALQKRGVRFIAPETVFIAPDVLPERISAGVEIHPGCRLHGAALSIGPKCVLGEEGPVTLRDCQLGARVRARGGFLEGATLLEDVDAGSCAHIRPGTLLEEGVSFGHAVGLKQTVLLPFMTAGSLINFCDALMSGGTSRKDHSEIGSSYVHFNFTPHQDKATASLIGDVPRGVMMNQPPIFLGGQGGLVGPCRITYGTVIAAGQICRKDVLTPGHLIRAGASAANIDQPYDPRLMGGIDRIVLNNLHYLGNLLALDAWWRLVRVRFVQEDWQHHCHAGALLRLTEMFDERLKRLDQLAEKVALSLSIATASTSTAHASQRAFITAWPKLREALQTQIAARTALTLPCGLIAAEGRASPPAASQDYLAWVQALPPADKHALTAWLQGLVDTCVSAGA